MSSSSAGQGSSREPSGNVALDPKPEASRWLKVRTLIKQKSSRIEHSGNSMLPSSAKHPDNEAGPAMMPFGFNPNARGVGASFIASTHKRFTPASGADEEAPARQSTDQEAPPAPAAPPTLMACYSMRRAAEVEVG